MCGPAAQSYRRPARLSAASRRSKSPLTVGRDDPDELLLHARGILVLDLARAGRLVAPAAVLEHQRADVRARRAIEDRLADGEHRVLLLEAPQDVHRDVALGEQRVEHEAVGRVDDLLAA